MRAQGWGWRHSGRKAWALRGITVQIEPGERVLLAGASGSGKSTLLQALAGVLDPEEGESEGTLEFGGLPPGAPELRGRVGLVQQDPDAQIVMSRVGDEVAFGLENSGVPRDQIWGRVQQALRDVGLKVPLGRSTAHLSGGQKQRLALACALAMGPEVILLDEPTANLDPGGGEELRRVVRQSAAETGSTLIVVDHVLEPWLDQVDRIIVLERGRIVADGPVQEVLREQAKFLREAGVWVPGEKMDDLLATIPSSLHLRSMPVSSEPALQTAKLVVGYDQRFPVSTSLDLTVESGQVTSIVGPNGAGKTTLALTLAGLLPPVDGNIKVAGSIRRRRDGTSLPEDPGTWSGPELLGRISMVFQEPEYQFLESTVEEELSLGLRLALAKKGKVLGDSEDVERYLKVLRLEHLRSAHPMTLSGGEKRRLSVASALISAPRILILDEPTFGQDRNTWAGLVVLLQEVAAAGTAVVAITHDQKFVEAVHGTVIPLEAPADLEVTQEPPKPGLISKVNPVTQVVGLTLMTMPLVVTIDILSAALALVLQFLMLPFLGMRPQKLLGRLVPLYIAIPFAVISMVLYGAPGGVIYWQWGPAAISDNSITLATALALRILAVGGPAILLLSRIDPTDLADGATQILRMPPKLVLSALAGGRMVGLMMTDWQALARARRSRGLGKGNRFRAFYRGAFAMLTFAIRRAGTLSLTMEARGFGGSGIRSNARDSHLGWPDVLMLVVCVAVPILALGVAVHFGTFRWFGL